MTDFVIGKMPYSTVLYLHSDKDELQLDPDYQRESDIWLLEKRQLLIDSIINGYDIPKIYFHKFSKSKKIGGKKYTHAIIDGKQRLKSIWNFIDGKFSLSDDIEFFADSDIDLRGLTYAELGQEHPKLKMRFDSYPLSVITIETDDIDLIEDMFSRLNEAVPLSAAEKRNAFGGPIPTVIRRLAKSPFFKDNLPFGNKRYRHYDLIAKFLLIEEKDGIVDTKKVHLDSFVSRWKSKSSTKADKLGASAKKVLAKMSGKFTDSDYLLRSAGTLILYYHVFRLAIDGGWLNEITRAKFNRFESDRSKNRAAAEEDISTADYNLLEYDRYVQTPNDSYAIAVRLRILLDRVFNAELDEEY